MKKLLLVLLIASAIGCKKEEVITPQPIVRGVDSLKIEIYEANKYLWYNIKIEKNNDSLLIKNYLSGNRAYYLPVKIGDTITGHWYKGWAKGNAANATFEISYNGKELQKIKVMMSGSMSGESYTLIDLIVK